jgi:hypothetical protein
MMSPGGTYIGLLTALHQDEVLDEMRRRRRVTTPIRRRGDGPLAATFRRVFRGPKA